MTVAMAGKYQHTTQAFYLKHFEGTEPDECVWVYDKIRDADPRPASRESISAEAYYYSTPKADGTWDASLDDWITDAEKAALPAYHQILEHKFPTGRDRKHFIMWLALAHTRTRAMRRITAETQSRAKQSDRFQLASDDAKFKAYMERYDAATGIVTSEEDRKKVRYYFLHPDENEHAVSKAETLLIFAKIEKLVPILERMTFILRVPEGDSCLITSDVPVGIFNPSGSRKGENAFARPTAEMRIPLSPKLMLMMRHDKVPELVLPYAAGLVREQNTSRIKAAEQEVYAHKREDWIQKLVVKYKTQRPQVPVHFDGPKKFGRVVVPRK